MKTLSTIILTLLLAWASPVFAVKFGGSISAGFANLAFEDSDDAVVEDQLNDVNFEMDTGLVGFGFSLMTGASDLFSYKLDLSFVGGEAEFTGDGISSNTTDLSGFRWSNGFRFRFLDKAGIKMSAGPAVVLTFLENDYGNGFESDVVAFGLGPVLACERDFGPMTGAVDLSALVTAAVEDDDFTTYTYVGSEVSLRLSFLFGD